MVDSSRLFHLLKFVLPLVIVIWSLDYLARSHSTYTEVLRKFRDEKKLFIADFLDHEIDGRFDGSAITALCTSKKWTKGLMLSCEPPPGGIGEVKNAHLHCIRFAMEMGAELILPEIVKRSEQDITKLIPNPNGPIRGIPLDYFFDKNHLNYSLSTYCPQMKVYSSINDLYNQPNVQQPIKFGVTDLTESFVNASVIEHPEEIPRQLKEFLDKQSPPDKRKYPVRFHLSATVFRWPTAYDPPEFVRNFGRILRIREDVRRIAASGLFNMQKQFKLKLDPRSGIKRDSFVGVHLRTEKDVEGAFADYDTQAAYYLSYVVDSHAPLVYLASGATGQDIDSFTARAKDFNVTTVVKKDILDGTDIEVLGKLSWDQRALIDYEIMLRAGLVAGMSESSFSWNLAMRRQNAYGDFGGSEPVTSGKSHNIMWKDRFSTVFGNSVRGQAMQSTIWP